MERITQIVVLLLVCALAGCVEVPGGPAGACRQPDHPCPSDFRCSGAVCLPRKVLPQRQACSADLDCADGLVCKLPSQSGGAVGLCVQCLGHQHCDFPLVCTLDHQCVACLQNIDCPSGLCVNFGCASCDSSNITCGVGAVCENEKCVNCSQDADCSTDSCIGGVCRRKKIAESAGETEGKGE